MIERWESLPSDAKALGTLSEFGFLGFWVCDYRTGVVSASPGINRLFGFDAEVGCHLLGDYLAKIHPEDRERLSVGERSSLSVQGISTVEYRMVDGVGQTHWILCRARFTRDLTNEVVGGQGIVFDSTMSQADILVTDIMAIEGDSKPLNQLTDLLLEAYEMAKGINNASLISSLEFALLTAAKLLARRHSKMVRSSAN